MSPGPQSSWHWAGNGWSCSTGLLTHQHVSHEMWTLPCWVGRPVRSGRRVQWFPVALKVTQQLPLTASRYYERTLLKDPTLSVLSLVGLPRIVSRPKAFHLSFFLWPRRISIPWPTVIPQLAWGFQFASASWANTQPTSLTFKGAKVLTTLKFLSWVLFGGWPMLKAAFSSWEQPLELPGWIQCTRSTRAEDMFGVCMCPERKLSGNRATLETLFEIQERNCLPLGRPYQDWEVL